MKKSVYLLLAGMIFTFLSSCMIQQPVQRVVAENNQDYEVDYLFEHAGCKVYRFRDGDRYVYFTNCSGSSTAIKNDSTKVTIQTISRGY